MRRFLNFRSLKNVFPFFALFAILFSVYHISFAKKIIPGVYVAGVKLGGTDYYKANELLKSSDPIAAEKITAVYDDKEFVLQVSELDLHYDWDSSIRRAYEVGRTGNPFIDFKDKTVGLIKPLKVDAKYTFDENALNSFISQILAELDIPALNASFDVSEDTLIITQEHPGRKVVKQELYDDLVSSLGQKKFSQIKISIKPAKPKVTKDDLDQFYDSAQAVISNPIKLTFEDKTFEPSKKEKAGFITYDAQEDILALNKSNFDTYLESVRSAIYQTPRGKVTKLNGERVLNFEITTSGRDLDRDTVHAAFRKAFFAKESVVPIAVREIKGPDDAQKYGIYALLGKGTSKFAGSAVARVNNLTLAADRTDGVLVAPGGVYSFNSSVGDISATSGYDTAYVISNGKTVLGEGGGVCQTSTTLFRAALNAGLPIVSRYAHAYRVYYYEIDSPVGFDASIYQPSLDFKFKNDTPNYILVQTAYDRNAQTLEFSIYGTPDGREVKITDPIVTNVSPPPEAQYQDDPTLPKGTVKQVDFAAWGASVSFDRTVMRNGEVLLSDTFKSNYRPWRAVYMVGTKN